jgi:hypothetical protein
VRSSAAVPPDYRSLSREELVTLVVVEVGKHMAITAVVIALSGLIGAWISSNVS